MARRNLEIIVTVRDAASQPLQKVEGQLKRTGSAANNASADFTKFNKTIFTTAAFVGTFVKAFSALTGALDKGAELDRIQTQFERVLGPKGNLLRSIKSMTSTTVDEVTAMQEGIKLANLGLVQNSTQMASIFAKASTAAKLAGIDSAEGMKKYSAFMEDGSVSNLEFLGILNRTNPAFQLQQAILAKFGGVAGGVIATQQRLALGQALLDARVRGHLQDQRDLMDVMKDYHQQLASTRSEIGRFLGQALKPLIEKFTLFLFDLKTSIAYYRQNEKTLVFLTKAAIIFTAAITGLVGALGTLSLVVRLLGFAGVGLPGLSLAIMAVTLAFTGLTNKADSIMGRLKIFGAFLQGIFQIIESFDPKTGFAEMDKSVHDMLEKAGLLHLVENIGKVGSIIKVTVRDAIEAFRKLSGWLDRTFGNISAKIIGLLDGISKPWSDWWTRDSLTPLQKFVRSATVIFGGFFLAMAGKKAFGLFSDLLSKIPIVGRLFGSTSKAGAAGGGMFGGGPTGSADNPLYVKIVDGSTGGGVAGGVASGAAGAIVGKLIPWLAGQMVGLSMMFDLALKGTLSAFVASFGYAIPAIATAVAGAAGVGVGLLVNKIANMFQITNKEGFQGNIFEQGMFQLSKLTGLGPAAEFIKNQKKFEFNMANSPAGMGSSLAGSKTEISVPKMPSSQEAVIDALGEQMTHMEATKRSRFEQSVESALASNSPGGEQVSPEEWRDLMVQALDNSQNLNAIANKAKQSSNIGPQRSRRQSGFLEE